MKIINDKVEKLRNIGMSFYCWAEQKLSDLTYDPDELDITWKDEVRWIVEDWLLALFYVCFNGSLSEREMYEDFARDGDLHPWNDWGFDQRQRELYCELLAKYGYEKPSIPFESISVH